MLQFQPLKKEDLQTLKPYFKAPRTLLSDYSIGFLLMWRKSLSLFWGIFENFLLLRERYAGKEYYYYPISIEGSEEGEIRALEAIEEDCRDKNLRLHFTNVPEEKLLFLLKRYGRDCAVNDRRRWRDYLYETKDFQEYGGKEHAKKRNHVRKFLSLYPNWEFRPLESSDFSELREFLKRLSPAQTEKGTIAREEMEETLKLLPEIQPFGLLAGILRVEGEIAGFSVGEICGDMLIIHIEKADRKFEGVYPFLSQQFALRFGSVRYLNRMDDAGDLGLRKSKLQSSPCRLVSKYTLLPRRAIDEMRALPEIKTDRLLLAPIKDEDEKIYARLARDTERNRYWGYDWRADKKGEPDDRYFLACAREDFKRKEEAPLGIYLEGKLIGEAVMHRFGYASNVELGVRLLPEAEGFGYASEAMRALARYCFEKLDLERAEAKCYRENVRSEKMLRLAGFLPSGEDAAFFYFEKTPVE